MYQRSLHSQQSLSLDNYSEGLSVRQLIEAMA